MNKKITTAIVASFMSASVYAAQDGWGYGINNGPTNWHQLSSDNVACSAGVMQSPINIEGTDPAVMHRLHTNYTVSPVNLIHRNHNIDMMYQPGSTLNVGQKTFTLQGFEFRTPSEHTVSGKRFPLEIQFKHRAADGSWAIVSTLVEAGAVNKAATEIWPVLPIEPGQTAQPSGMFINARDFMPNDKSYFRYMGSLTTPPCSEGVNWYVLKKPITFSAEQISLFSGLIGGSNARPVQPRNNRIILDARPE